MLKLRIKAPCYVYKLDEETCEESLIDIKDKLFLLEGCLNQDGRFLVDLAKYACNDDHIYARAILPDPQVKKNDKGFYIEINVYSYLPILREENIRKVVDYVRGQVSDGWGENGFELYDEMMLAFDWESVEYIDCSPIPDEEFEKMYKDYRMLKAHASSSYDSTDINEALLDLIKSIREATEVLKSIKIDKEEN